MNLSNEIKVALVRCGGDSIKRAATIPTRQMIQPAEVARTCLFLAEPLNSLTGTTLLLDGGSAAAGCYI
jgi:NAD(P)-dependent dehydrogenase (short-subunit alcohol dehydrogenase family)